MSCDLCLISEKDSFVEIAKSTCPHKFCVSCFNILKDQFDGKCPIDSKNLKFIAVKNINGNIRKQCQDHGRDFSGLCKVHYKLVCPQCTQCQQCSIYEFESDITQELEQIIENQSRNIKDLKLPEEFVELYEGWENTLDDELKELERIKGIIEAALNLEDLETLQGLDKQYSDLFTKQAVEKVKDDFEVVEVAVGNLNQRKSKVDPVKKNRAPAAGGPRSGPNPSNSFNQGGGGMGMEGGMEAGPGQGQEEVKMDERVVQMYNDLNQQGKNCLRLFYKMNTHGEQIITRLFYLSQDIEDLVYLSGMAVGVSPVSDFVVLVSLEIYIENDSIVSGEELIFKTMENNNIELFMFKKKIKLPRGAPCFVSVTVQGEGINVFELQIPGKVVMLDPNSQMFNQSSPILYFLIDK